jgi:hypothetical protein
METSDDQSPRGAFLLLVLFLVFVTLAWTNVYLRLWWRG